MTKHSIKTCAVGIGLGALLFAAHAGAEEKTYVLAGSKLPPAGTVAVETSGDEMPESPMTISANGQNLSGTMKEKSSSTETTTFQGPDKFTRELNSSSTERSMTINGHADDTPSEPKTLEKVPVTYERKNGKWTLTLADGKSLSEAQLKELGAKPDQPFASDEATFGTAPRKVGDKWDVDVTKIPAFGGVGAATGSMSCELMEAKTVQGLPAAVVKITFDVTGIPQDDEDDGPKVKLHLKGEGASTRCTEFDLELENSIKSEMDVEILPETNVEIKTSGPYTMKSSVVLKKP